MSTSSAASGECAAEASELQEEQQPEPQRQYTRQQEDERSIYTATPRELLVLCIDPTTTVEQYY